VSGLDRFAASQVSDGARQIEDEMVAIIEKF